MCSIVEDDFGDEGGAHAMIEDPKTNGFEGEICKKCKIEESKIKLDFRESMCESCFLTYVRHKFRAALGSTKVVRRHSNVLLHFNGRVESICLAHMVMFSFEQETHKRLCFNMDFIFIDEYCIEGTTNDVDKRYEKLEVVRNVLKQFPNFKCFYSSIAGSSSSDIPLINEITKEDVTRIIQEEETFKSSFKSLKSLSTKQDFLAMQRNKILRILASSLIFQYVFVPDISITLATRLLTDIAVGRGSSAALDVAFCDDRIESLKFVRPIKDLSEVEVASYVKFNKLNTLSDENYGDNFGQFASIQNLTSKFINGLQENFSSTVSTVYRTCSKISSKEVSNQQRCEMCKSLLDYQDSETLFAIEFSRSVSKLAGNEDNLKNMEEIQTNSIMSVNGSENDLKRKLCHGCRNIFIDLDENCYEILS
ncbi:CLUMA_CG016493, isoform A [Clunio marinus]|uniref:Cytoplasmic tRNA 2-thiolation protein 2 n=1 Tax=Clunio marinus TaxID=568069 RepID=A0A1J1IS99_9DIPT|nr:CLUMA_CG016493, isoform A [Clunio marinus]